MKYLLILAIILPLHVFGGFRDHEEPMKMLMRAEKLVQEDPKKNADQIYWIFEMIKEKCDYQDKYHSYCDTITTNFDIGYMVAKIEQKMKKMDDDNKNE